MNNEFIIGMRQAGNAAASVLDMITPYVKKGVSTEYLNDICHDYIVHELNAIPAPLNYRGFPKSICTSVNHVICHGIPNNDKILKDGDIINIDVTVIKNGYHGDTSRMYCIGNTSIQARRLVDVAKECLYIGISQVKPGAFAGDIGNAIQTFAENAGFSVVREYCGHGIGKEFHTDPQILHHGKPNTGVVLEEGMAFTIEPMINVGHYETKMLKDGWTVVTKDHSLSAQYEHTVLVTKTGVEILTTSNESNLILI